MPICQHCKSEFPNKININGQIFNLSKRKFCTKCSPLNGRNTKSYIIKLRDGETFCARCQKTKTPSDFYKRKSGKPFSYCIECQEEVKKLKFEEKLETIIQIFGGVCADCQVSFPAPVYEFYSENEVFSIGRIKNMSLQRIINSLKEHIMLCKNCSALRQWEKTTRPE